MKFGIDVFVIRLNDEVVEIYPLNDEGYETIMIILDSRNLSDSDIKKYYFHMNEEYINKRLVEVRASGNLSDEQEAKDLGKELSQYSMGIEKHTVEIN